jgi:excisionase family DNA binding protein
MSTTSVMTTKEVAEYLKMDAETITKLAKGNKIPGRKVGHRWRFHRDVIERWLQGGGATALSSAEMSQS